ncbi:hypothetical protein BsWGS_24840 [Bradybaena similaris]
MACFDPLEAEVGSLFEEFVIPANVLLQCRSFLNKKEIEFIDAEANIKGPSEGARLLFNIIIQKKGSDWFSKTQTLLCDERVKLQHVADMMANERNRFQPQSAIYRRSNRNGWGEPTTLSGLYIKYNRELDTKIRPLFLPRIDDPVMALHVLQSYSGKVLTKVDCDNVKAKLSTTGDHEGANLLFSRLVLYEDWPNVLLKALRDDEIKLSDVADEIELLILRCKIKEDYEKKRSEIQHLYKIEEDMQIEDDSAAADDPGSVEMANDTRDRSLRDSNVRDEYESDNAAMRPMVKRQVKSASNKENTVSDGSGDGRNLASQGCSSEDGHGTTGKTKLMSAAASEGGHGTTGKTKLMSAAASGKIDLILSLIDGGADLNEFDSNGKTSLMYAVLNRKVECIRLLISKGCNVNKRDINGCTALMISANKGFPDCMACLIEGKSDLDNANNAGTTALMVAARNGFFDCMWLLIRKGCDINKCKNDGRTALMFAAFKGHAKCVDLLITSKCAINGRNEKMATALMFAAQGGRQECVKLLINGGADVNLLDEEHNTAVMYAVLFNQVECLHILIVNHADFNIANKYGFTPLKVAKDKKFQQCVEVLEAAMGCR